MWFNIAQQYQTSLLFSLSDFLFAVEFTFEVLSIAG